MNLTFNQAIVFLPLATAIITFFLTSIFTIYKEGRSNNISKRIFFEYAEFEISYPFDKEAIKNHGEGRILKGKNGKQIINSAEEYPGSTYTYLVLKNITNNDAINVKIKHVFSNGTKAHAPTKIVDEEFFMPVWQAKDTLYIPASIYDGTSHFSCNEELSITYVTTSFEHFKYSYSRQEDGTYKERLKKRYLGFIWINKVKYQTGNFYSYNLVKEKKNEAS